MRIRQFPVVRKFQIAIFIGIVLMIEQVIQSQRERIIGRHIVMVFHVTRDRDGVCGSDVLGLLEPV